MRKASWLYSIVIASALGGAGYAIAMDANVQQQVIDILEDDSISISEKRTRILKIKGISDSDLYAVDSTIEYYQAADSAQQRAKDAERQSYRIDQEIVSANKSADTARAEIDRLEAVRDQAKRDYKDAPSSTLWNPLNWGKSKSERLEGRANKKDAHAALDEAGAKLDRAEARLAEEEKRLDERRDMADRARGAARDARKDADRKIKEGRDSLLDQYRAIKDLEKEIADAKVSQKFSDLRSKISNSRVRIEAMNRVYDNAILGSYFAAKMAALLASDEFCSAVSKCKDGKSLLRGNAPDLSNLFSGNPITRKSDKLIEETSKSESGERSVSQPASHRGGISNGGSTNRPSGNKLRK